MERYENIFYNIVKNETSLTEVFCNLMMYKSFRNTFLEFVKDKNESFGVDIDKIKFEDFDTEKDFGFIEYEEDKKVGRGDLILSDNGREYIFELKIEIYTSTTKNQPNGYIDYLEERKKEYPNQSKEDLFFLLPKNYKHKKDLTSIEETYRVCENNILYWEDFINLLKIKGLYDVFYIKDFIDILNYRWFYSEKFEFNEFEKNIISNKRKIKMDEKTIPQIMMNLTQKIDLISSQLKQIDGFKLKDSKDENGYGVYINDVIWFGMDYKFWEKNGIPLSIGIDGSNNEYIKLLQNEFRDKVIEVKYETDEIYYHLPLSIIDEYKNTDTIKDEVVNIKKSLFNL